MSSSSIKTRADLPADAIVATCNAKAIQIESDVAFCMDGAMMEELICDERIHERSTMIYDRTKLQEVRGSGAKIPPTLHPGKNAFWYDFTTSTGVGAWDCLIRSQCSELWLCGFDGKRDPSNQFAGRKNYGRSPNNVAVMDEWENRMMRYWIITEDERHHSSANRLMPVLRVFSDGEAGMDKLGPIQHPVEDLRAADTADVLSAYYERVGQ